MGWMAEVGMEIFQDKCLKKLDVKIKEAKEEYELSPSITKKHYIQGLEEARLIVLKQSAY